LGKGKCNAVGNFCDFEGSCERWAFCGRIGPDPIQGNCFLVQPCENLRGGIWKLKTVSNFGPMEEFLRVTELNVVEKYFRKLKEH